MDTAVYLHCHHTTCVFTALSKSNNPLIICKTANFACRVNDCQRVLANYSGNGLGHKKKKAKPVCSSATCPKLFFAFSYLILLQG